MKVTGQEDERFTWSQIRYWVAGVALVLLGAAAAIGGPHLPYDWMQDLAKELGPGVFTAGLLALLVEPFFRREFARDAFLAAFRYVLPEQFKEEVSKILTHAFISEDHLWSVTIEKEDDEVVLVTTTFERKIRNRTSSAHKRRGWYTIEEFGYRNRPSQIIECSIESNNEVKSDIETKDHGRWIEAFTSELNISPNEKAKISGKAKQYRRINDIIFETFTDPIVNPKIEVNIDTNTFEYKVEFGTTGDAIKEKYSNRYALSSVYFPGQYMFVRWWPKMGLENSRVP